MQLGLLEYRPAESAPDRARAAEATLRGRRRATAVGLRAGVRIAVRRNSVRAADRGTVTEVFEDRAVVRYRSDRNGGSYDVELARVKILKPPKRRGRAPSADAVS